MFSTNIPAPQIVDRHVVQPLLCGPGPCDISPATIKCLSMPILSPFCDEYYNVIDDIREGLKYLFQTECPLVLAVTGAGHAGMETAISNLVGPKETLLIASRGAWDERAYAIAEHYNINIEVIKAPSNSTFSTQEIEAALKKTRPTAMFIVHGDSSTGTVQNLVGLGDLCHKYGTLLIVDAVVSIGGAEFRMDEWKVDAAFGATQKAMSGPAGFSPVAFSKLAEDKINSRTYYPPFFFDIQLLAKQWRCYVRDGLNYHHTMSPPLMWSLRNCLKEICEETLPRRWERHLHTAAYLEKRLEELGFKFFVPKPEDRLCTVTTVELPDGMDCVKFMKHLLKTRNILVIRGFGPTSNKAMRIGIMGINSTIQVADAVADGMAETLKALTKGPLE